MRYAWVKVIGQQLVSFFSPMDIGTKPILRSLIKKAYTRHTVTFWTARNLICRVVGAFNRINLARYIHTFDRYRPSAVNYSDVSVAEHVPSSIIRTVIFSILAVPIVQTKSVHILSYSPPYCYVNFWKSKHHQMVSRFCATRFFFHEYFRYCFPGFKVQHI